MAASSRPSAKRGTLDGQQSAPVPAASAEARQLIGQALREHYADITQAPIPPRFLELLDQLEARHGKAKSE